MGYTNSVAQKARKGYRENNQNTKRNTNERTKMFHKSIGTQMVRGNRNSTDDRPGACGCNKHNKGALAESAAL